MVSAILKLNDSESVELKYTAFRAEALENELGDGLLNGLAKIDRVGVMVKYIAHGAGISADEARAAIDKAVDGGKTLEDINEVIVQALINGGFISKTAMEAAKNLRGKLLRTAPQS